MLMPVLVDLCLWFTAVVCGAVTEVSRYHSPGASGVQPAESLDMAREALLSLRQEAFCQQPGGMPSLLGGGIPEGMWRPGLSIEVASLPIALILTVA